MEAKPQAMNGQSQIESLNSNTAETSGNDKARDALENKSPFNDGTETTEDQPEDGKNILDVRMKNESLKNEVQRSNNPEMNGVAISSHTAVLEELQRHIQELESDQDSKIIVLLQKLNQEYQREIGDIKREFHQKVELDVGQENVENSMVLREKDKLIQLLKDEHRQEVEKLRKMLEEDYQNQVLKISDELRDHYQNDVDEKITKLEEDWELEFLKQKHEFDERVTAVQKEQWTQCQEAVERVALDAEDQLRNMKHAHDCETAEFKRQIHELLEKQTLSEMKEKQLDNEKYQKENESSEKIKSLEEQLSDERDELEAQITAAQNEIKTLKEEHERHLESLKSDLEKKYSDVLSESKNEMKSKYQAELDEKVHRVESYLRQQYEQDLEKTKEELHESSTTFKTKYEKQLAEVFSQLEELHERNQQHELREANLKKDYEHAKKTVKELRREVEKQNQKNQQQEETADDYNVDRRSQFKGLEKEELHRSFDEKKILEDKIHVLTSQLDSLTEKVNNNEKEKEEMKSQYESDILKIKSSYEEEVCKLTMNLERRKTTIANLKETSRAHELEIANLILHSPKPTEADEVEREFKFGNNPEERIKLLEIEVTKYKKKVTELEEEAEDKFETILCHNCEGRGSREHTVVEAKALVEKIENDCKEKIEALNKNHEITERKLEDQIKISKDLANNFKKIEIELDNERKRRTELSTFNKHLVTNHMLLTKKTEEQMSDVPIEPETLKNPTVSNEENEDKTAHEENIEKFDLVGQSEILKVKEEYEKLSKEKEELKTEIDRKAAQLSMLMDKNDEMQRFQETLREKLRQDEQKYKELTLRVMDQKTNYESEIQLMQKEIKVLIQENKEYGSKCEVLEGYEEENAKLRTKIEELKTTMTKRAADHQKEIDRLNETILGKETSLLDLKNMHQLLEISSREIDVNIANLKKHFEEKERGLLDEINEKTARFEREKNEILENSIQEKEELQAQIDDLERLCKKNSDIWLKCEGESEISKSNTNEKLCPNEAEEMPMSDHNSFVPFKYLSTERSLLTDYEGSTRSMDGHDWINRDRQSEGSDTSEFQYDDKVNEIYRNEPEYEPSSTEDAGYNCNVSMKKDDTYSRKESMPVDGEYGRIQKDVGYYINMTSRGDERSRENSCFQEQEKEKYHLEIELDLEKKEKEWLKKELCTITRCVNVFHEECQCLRSSLDNALEMYKIMKRGRDDLLTQNNRSLEENSEIMLDLIKYEEIIKNLETGNEKLQKEKEVLQECLVQTGTKLSSLNPKSEVTGEHSMKQNPEIQTIFPRSSEKVKNYEDSEFTVRTKEIDYLMQELDQELTTTEDSGEMKDRLQEPVDVVEQIKKEPVSKSILDSQGIVTEDKHWRKYQSRNSSSHKYGNRRNNSTLRQTRFAEVEPMATKSGKITEIKYLDMYTKLDLQKAVAPDKSNRSNVAKVRNIRRLNSWNTSRNPRNFRGTPSNSTFQKPEMSSTVSYNFVTSTGTNSDFNVRLAPNLSGLSPIVSQLDRRQHDEILNWSSVDDIPSCASLDCLDDDADSTTLTTADPFGHKHTQTPATTEPSSYEHNTPFSNGKRQNSRKLREKHQRSNSADVRLFNSTNKASGYESAGLYLEKPLTINFEDFVFRHRVKSSEDVANLRDPSPAELWFS